MAQILIIEDNRTMREGMVQTLVKADYQVQACATMQEGLAWLRSHPVDCLITDLKLADGDGIEVLRRAKEHHQAIPVIVITAFGSIETAVEAMKLGALDFITKPFPPDLLRVKVHQATQIMQLSQDHEKLFYENQYLRTLDPERHQDRRLIGTSPSLRDIRLQIEKIADTDASVCLRGESGTGKELVARAIHQQSSRRDKPFIKINCSALAPGILESELFGHERGAFTGALKRKPGRFEMADGGTLLLDEIGDIHADIQLKLLRVLQEREFERVGGTTTLKVDVRIISATHQNLEENVKQGLFRQDLYYRLVIVPLWIPALRDRREDIPALIEHFTQQLAKKHGRSVKRFTPAALELLMSYQWPGNIRELENLMEQLTIMHQAALLDVEDMPNILKIKNNISTLASANKSGSLPDILDQTERDLITQALKQAGGVKTHVAKLLGIKTSALYYKLEKYGLLDRLEKSNS